MKSEEKVKKLHPDWYSFQSRTRSVFGKWRVRDQEGIGRGRGRSERAAWADAWRRIAAARVAKK